MQLSYDAVLVQRETLKSFPLTPFKLFKYGRTAFGGAAGVPTPIVGNAGDAAYDRISRMLPQSGWCGQLVVWVIHEWSSFITPWLRRTDSSSQNLSSKRASEKSSRETKSARRHQINRNNELYNGHIERGQEDQP